MWGDGFLSPGGPEEVASMLEGVDLRGCSVLDVGSGLGAVDVLLAEQYGAVSVRGVDVEAHLIDEGRHRAELAGVSDTVKGAHNLAELTQFAPGHRQNGRAWHRK